MRAFLSGVDDKAAIAEKRKKHSRRRKEQDSWPWQRKAGQSIGMVESRPAEAGWLKKGKLGWKAGYLKMRVMEGLKANNINYVASKGAGASM